MPFTGTIDPFQEEPQTRIPNLPKLPTVHQLQPDERPGPSNYLHPNPNSMQKDGPKPFTEPQETIILHTFGGPGTDCEFLGSKHGPPVLSPGFALLWVRRLHSDGPRLPSLRQAAGSRLEASLQGSEVLTHVSICVYI